MPAHANIPAPPFPNQITAANIYFPRYRFKVVRVYATAYSADMIQIQAVAARNILPRCSVHQKRRLRKTQCEKSFVYFRIFRIFRIVNVRRVELLVANR